MNFIKTFIGNLGINTKLSMLLGLPILGIIILNLMQITSTWDEIDRLQKMEQASNLNVTLGNVLHELQHERTASAGFVASKGSLYGTTLHTQRAETDQAINVLKDYVEELDHEALTKEGDESLKHYLNTLSSLAGERAKVDAQSTSTDDLLKAFDNLTKGLLHVATTTVQSAYDPDLTVSADLSMMNASYFMFMSMKEKTAAENALLTTVFIKNEIDPEHHDHVVELAGDQAALKQVFMETAEENYRTILQKETGAPVVAAANTEATSMRETALHKKSRIGVDIAQWQRAATTRIDGLHAAEKLLTEDILGENADMTAEAQQTLWKLIIIVSILIGFNLLQGIITASGIINSLKETMAVLHAMADGDLTQRVTSKSKDEIGQMNDYLAQALDNLESTVSAIAANSQTLSGAAEEMTSVSQQMGANAEETSAQAGVVSGASETISNNVQTVASGIEELSATTREIASNAAEAAKIALSAVDTADSANATVSKLNVSSTEIGEIINAINSIAQQTKLLALNATIEAARAGEAGKGFAVVANEVKDLAVETGKASDDIAQKIEVIQADTTEAVEAINKINEVIGRINEFQSTIASAVEEQSATAGEISRNVADVAQGSGEISQNIASVAEAAQSTSTGANDTLQASAELSRMAAELQQHVSKFKLA